MSGHDAPSSDLYRLERTRVGGERLTPVQTLAEATHAGIAGVRHLIEAHARQDAASRAEIERLRAHVASLDLRVGRAIHTVDQAEMRAAQETEVAARLRVSVQRLETKIAEVIDEKRRLRAALIGQKPLPVIHYRLDVDRDDVARESIAVTLDAFPHQDRLPDALAEARRVAERRDGQLRTLRLDTTAWRAVIQRIIDG